MNLTGRPVYQKGEKRRSRGKARPKNAAESKHWENVLGLGKCMVGPFGCRGRLTIHHCGTGAGGRKDHMKVLPLCEEHHQGREGIDGKAMSKRDWQEKYGTEDFLLFKLEALLNSNF